MSEEDASANLSKIEGFTDSIEEFQLTTVAELANSLPPEKHFKKTARNLKEKWEREVKKKSNFVIVYIHRHEQACGLLEVRKSHILKKLEALRTRDPPPAIVQEKEQTEVAS